MLNLFTRKNFPEKIKLKIIKKASRCQMCQLQTECGECAHIVAAGRDGPRNKHQLVQDHIISADYETNTDENGLYLCANCHTLIDRYPEKYTYEYLVGLKSNLDDKNDKPITKSCMDLITNNENDKQTKEENSGLIVNDSKNHITNKSTEDGDKMYFIECTFCQKSFTSKQSLQYHISHNVCQKPGKICPKCGYKFANKSALIYHTNNDVYGSTGTCKKKITLKKNYENMSREEMIQHMSHLEGQVEALKENPRTINNNNNNQINFIFPKSFGTEQID